MKLQYHKNLTQERWNKFSLAQQLANVGADVGRAIKWRDKDDRNFKLAFERALELLDLTRADKKNHSVGKLKELCYLRGFLVDWYFDNEFNTPASFFENYFYQFNYLANNPKSD
jgi:hypothetical protein